MRVAAFGVALGLTTGFVFNFATASLADSDMIAAEQISGTSVSFVLRGSHSNATLSIIGPDGFQASTFSPGGAVAIDLSKHGPLHDGSYNYQLTAASSERVKAKDHDGRSGERKAFARRPAAKNGSFNVKGGKIVDYGTATRAGPDGRDPPVHNSRDQSSR